MATVRTANERLNNLRYSLASGIHQPLVFTFLVVVTEADGRG